MGECSAATTAMVAIKRHFMGRQEPVRFTDYESLTKRFQKEVRELWKQEERRQEDEQDG